MRHFSTTVTTHLTLLIRLVLRTRSIMVVGHITQVFLLVVITILAQPLQPLTQSSQLALVTSQIQAVLVTCMVLATVTPTHHL